MSELHPRARALIDAAKRGEGTLSPDVRARVHRSVLRRAVAFGAAVATAGTTSAVSKAAALFVALSGSLAIPAVVVSTAAGAALLVFEARSTPPVPRPAPSAPTHVAAPLAAPLPFTPKFTPEFTPEPAPAPVTQVAPTPILSPPSRPRAPAIPTPPVASPEAAPGLIAPSTAGPLQAPSPPLAVNAVPEAPAPLAAHLAEDLALLRQAHQALRGGDPAAALSLLDRPGSTLDAGPLAEEAQLLRISALCQLGRTTAAHAATERLLAAWPGSPAGKRLLGGCPVLAAPAKAGED